MLQSISVALIDREGKVTKRLGKFLPNRQDVPPEGLRYSVRATVRTMHPDAQITLTDPRDISVSTMILCEDGNAQLWVTAPNGARIFKLIGAACEILAKDFPSGTRVAMHGGEKFGRLIGLAFDRVIPTAIVQFDTCTPQEDANEGWYKALPVEVLIFDPDPSAGVRPAGTMKIQEIHDGEEGIDDSDLRSGGWADWDESERDHFCARPLSGFSFQPAALKALEEADITTIGKLLHSSIVDIDVILCTSGHCDSGITDETITGIQEFFLTYGIGWDDPPAWPDGR